MNWDIVFEGLKFATSLVLFVSLWSLGRKYSSLADSSWNIILFGFFLASIGFAFDLADEFIESPAFVLPGTIMETVGGAGGLLLATIGFSRWFNFMSRFLGVSQN